MGARNIRSHPGKPKTKERPVHELFPGTFRGTKVQFVNRACFPKEKTPEFTKMGEIHELFVLALALVWFAGATPEDRYHLSFWRFFSRFYSTFRPNVGAVHVARPVVVKT